MKICKNKKHSHIVFSEGDYAECPLCEALDSIKLKNISIDEMHEASLAREDYMCALEKSNTRMQEDIRAARYFSYDGKLTPISVPLFTYESVTTMTTTKPTKKRATTKGTTKSTTKGTTKKTT